MNRDALPSLADRPGAAVPRPAPMSKAWWIAYGVALAVLGVSYAWQLVPHPERGWDALGRGIARLLAGFAGMGAHGLLAACALPGAIAGHAGRWNVVGANLLTAAAWGLLVIVDD